MYVRIARATVDLAQEKEVQRIAEDALVPALQALPGFQSYIGGLDRSAVPSSRESNSQRESSPWRSRFTITS